MALLDKWWEAVLGESTDDEGEISVDTNSESLQSCPSASTKKQITWLLPRHSASHEESLDKDSDIFDFSSLAGRTSDNKAQTKQKSTRKSKWGFRKKTAEKGSQQGRKSKKKQNEQRDDADQQNGWFGNSIDSSINVKVEEDRRDSTTSEKGSRKGRKSQKKQEEECDNVDQQNGWFGNFFDSSIIGTAEEDQRDSSTFESDNKGDDLTLAAEYGIFGDALDDNPSYDESEQKDQDRYDRRFSLDNSSTEEDEVSESSSSLGAHVDVWDSTGLLGSPSDVTSSTQESSCDNTNEDAKPDLLPGPQNGVSSSNPKRATKKTNSEHRGSAKPISSLEESTVDINSFTGVVGKQSRGASKESLIGVQTKKHATIPHDYNGKDNDADIPMSRAKILEKNTKGDKRRVLSSKKTGRDSDRKSSSWRQRIKTDKTTSSGEHQKSRLLGMVLCQSKKHGDYGNYGNVIPPDGSIGKSGHSDTSDKYAVVRMVPDSKGSTRHGTSPNLLELSHLELASGRFPEHTATNLTTEDSKLKSDGPVSMYVYDCDYKNHMGVVFDNFNKELEVRKYSNPPSARPGDILVKVEVSNGNHETSQSKFSFLSNLTFCFAW